MDDMISVTLAGPAKIAGKVEPAGKTVEVNQTVLLHLAESGVVDLDVTLRDVPLASDFDAAVAKAAAQLAADTVDTAVTEALAKQAGELADALAKISDLEDQFGKAAQAAEGEHRAELEAADIDMDAAKARIVDLETKLAAAEAAAAPKAKSGK